MHFFVIRRPKVILTSTNLDDLSEEIKTLLNEFVDIIRMSFQMHYHPSGVLVIILI